MRSQLTVNDRVPSAARLVRHFRQILLWPLQLLSASQDTRMQKHWQWLEQAENNSWAEINDEFSSDPTQFQERHYNEFITFLPYVQRFLYGEGGARAGYGESPVRVFRRRDVAQARLTYNREEAPVVFNIAHIDLYFFYDLDIVILVVEIHADNLTLERVQDTLYRFGRAYPPYWKKDGQGGRCLRRVEWLSPTGDVLAVSDYEQREKYLSFVCQNRSPCIAAHWEYLLQPLVLHSSEQPGVLRYRQIEYHRMPLMAYLAMEDLHQLSRGDYVRLGLVTEPGDSVTLPFSARYLEDFETRYCYDRHREDRDGQNWIDTRTICCGHAFILVGNYKDRFFRDLEAGLLGQFRHQFFLLFLIAHMHKAALLMFSDRLEVTISRLDIQDVDSVRQFKRVIRHTMEIFLRFTQRYWFDEISNQMQIKDLFQMCVSHLETKKMFADVRQAVHDMHHYLDSDNQRRQANTLMRLTVVTILGMIGTIATGVLGMNIFDFTTDPWWRRLLIFLVVFMPMTLLVFYTIRQSKILSDFLEALPNERLKLKDKLRMLRKVWLEKTKTGSSSG